MASPTWHFDGDKLRIYEVPPHPSYTVDANGYRIYTSTDPIADMLVYADLKVDLWSRWVDWAYNNQWSLLAFSQSGGALRGVDQFGNEVYQSVDFKLLTDNGWRLVLANYPHEVSIRGNLYSESGHLFDHDRLDCTPSPVPRLEGDADLLTYRQYTGSGLTPEEQDKLDLIKRRLFADEERQPNRLILTDVDTGEVLLDKTVTGGQLQETIKIFDQ